VATLGVCIETFFTDLPYPERIRRAAACGYTAYEFWFPEQRFDGKGLSPEMKDLDAFAELNAKLKLTTTDFVLNHSAGAVVAALVERKDLSRILDEVDRYAAMATKVGCRALISGSGNTIPGQPRDEAVASMVEALTAMGKALAPHGITVLLEPWNSRVDHPGNFLDDPYLAVDVLAKVNLPNVKLLYDIYHNQIMAGDVVSFIRKNIARIGHFHVAGVPGRHEPHPCELDYAFILSEIDRAGYTGAVGLEYWPTMDHARSLKETRKALRGR
jgi:hydroxypyruvate isomerase